MNIPYVKAVFDPSNAKGLTEAQFNADQDVKEAEYNKVHNIKA